MTPLTQIAHKTMLGLIFAASTLLLTACGGPSEGNAKETAEKISTAMFNQETSTVLSYVNGYENLSEDDQELAHNKIGQMLELVAAKAEKHGGVDTIEATDYKELSNNRVNVKVLVTFDDGSTEDSTVKLQWDEASESYKLRN